MRPEGASAGANKTEDRNRASPVAFLGEQPPKLLTEKLDRLLSTGESASLPYNVLELLLKRRRQATDIGPWVERHYRHQREQ